MTLIDAGPLVALLDADDPQHELCRLQLTMIRDPLVTAWPPVTEAMHFLKGFVRGENQLLDWLSEGFVRTAELGREDLPRIKELMRKYADLPMDFADAALVRVAERERIRRVFTLDRRDFEIYRPRGLSRFEIMP